MPPRPNQVTDGVFFFCQILMNEHFFIYVKILDIPTQTTSNDWLFWADLIELCDLVSMCIELQTI